MKFLPFNTGVIVLAYPKMQVRPDLTIWLMMHGIPPERILHHCDGPDKTSGWNCSKKAALEYPSFSDCKQFIFCENDIMPNMVNAQPFLDTVGKVTACSIRSGDSKPWHPEGSIHLALWRCDREVIEVLGKKGIMQAYAEDGCTYTSCLCDSWTHAIRGSGFRIDTAGEVQHEPRACHKT